jgi:uncharacterized membrane protein YjgN (DUF898 family)
METRKPEKRDNGLLFKYIGLATQLMFSLGTAVFAGLQTDKWLSVTTPLLVWILPLLVLVIMMWKIIKDTSK